MLKVENLSRAWGDKVVLDELSFDLQPGEIYGLLGPNGSGKTTTIRILCGLLRQDAGAVFLDGAPLIPDVSRSRLGLATQEVALYRDLSCRENLEFFAEMWGLDRRSARARTEELIEMFGLEEYRDTAAGILSGGWQRRLHVAISVVHMPDIAILDEPTAGLDVEARSDLWRAIRSLRERGSTILLTTHDLQEAERVCDRVGILKGGRIAAEGSIAELRSLVPAASLAEVECVDDESAVTRGEASGWLVRRYRDRLTFLMPNRIELASVVGVFDGIDVSSVALREVNLEHAYLEVTAGAQRPVPRALAPSAWFASSLLRSIASARSGCRT